MARKTKIETQRTRQLIIDAARKMFFCHGIARTTLEAIAVEAGVTRGAVYWHFENKVDLFFTMREQTILPLIDRVDDALLASSQEGDPLTSIERALVEIFNALDHDDAAREVFQIIQLRCEYVGEFAVVIAKFEKSQNALVTKLARAYRRAEVKGKLRPGLKPRSLALDSVMFLSGLVRRRLSSAAIGMGKQEVLRAIRAHMELRRA
ncbi:MAG: TetR family transcriptional regulator [Burkholderiales bacterium]|nr:TetR family transcriptional regulator [Ferrovum sp.]